MTICRSGCHRVAGKRLGARIVICGWLTCHAAKSNRSHNLCEMPVLYRPISSIYYWNTCSTTRSRTQRVARSSTNCRPSDGAEFCSRVVVRPSERPWRTNRRDGSCRNSSNLSDLRAGNPEILAFALLDAFHQGVGFRGRAMRQSLNTVGTAISSDHTRYDARRPDALIWLSAETSARPDYNRFLCAASCSGATVTATAPQFDIGHGGRRIGDFVGSRVSTGRHDLIDLIQNVVAQRHLRASKKVGELGHGAWTDDG